MMNWFSPVAMLLLWTPGDATFDVEVVGGSTCALNQGEGISCWVSLFVG